MPGSPPGPWAVTLLSRDLSATHRALTDAGVPFARKGGRIEVAPEAACGAGLAFEEAAADARRA